MKAKSTTTRTLVGAALVGLALVGNYSAAGMPMTAGWGLA